MLHLTQYTVLTLLLMSFISQHTLAESTAKSSLEERATALLQRQLAESDSKRIPLSIRRTARCIAVFPFVVKAGILIAGQRGQGLVSCRKSSFAAWGAPAYYNITAASIGLQAGIQEASIILMAMTKSAADVFVDEKLSFGGNIGVAAGPIGAASTVDTSISVASYIRAEGLFAGVDLNTSNISFAKKANAEVYGKGRKARDILLTENEIPEQFRSFHETLKKLAPAVDEASTEDEE